jgi:hypothetical protein
MNMLLYILVYYIIGVLFQLPAIPTFRLWIWRTYRREVNNIDWIFLWGICPWLWPIVAYMIVFDD